MALTIALAAIALPAWRLDRRIAVVAGASGVVGLLVSGSLAGAIGLLAAGIVAAAAARASARRAAAILVISVAVLGGVVLFRGGDVKSFLHFAGIGKQEEQLGVESYVQRTMLVYYGWRVFLDHPLAGAGWQASNDEYVYGPLLPTLHREFPNTPPQAFPSPQHPYGVQNAYVQALSDLGVVGLRSIPRRADHAARPRRGPVAARPARRVGTRSGLVAARDHGRPDRDRPRRRHPARRHALDRRRPLRRPAAAHRAGGRRRARRPSPAPHPGWGAVPPPSTGNGTADLRA